MAIVKKKLDLIAKFVKKPRIKTLMDGRNICANGITIVVANGIEIVVENGIAIVVANGIAIVLANGIAIKFL